MSSSLQRIQGASEGLFYMSEGDYPFETVSIDATLAVLPDKLLELSGNEKGTKVEMLTLGQFLRNMILLPQNPSPEQQQTVQRFLALQQVLQEELTDIAVYLIGLVEKDAFILGRSAEGSYTGLRTKVIQT